MAVDVVMMIVIVMVVMMPFNHFPLGFAVAVGFLVQPALDICSLGCRIVEAAVKKAGDVGIAGDVFDFRIIDQVISPRLGKGGTYRVMGGADLPVPPDWYSAFARWHRLSLMKNPRTLRDMRDVMGNARDPHRLANLIDLVEDEMGYRLYQTVSAAKAALSTAPATRLCFRHKALEIDTEITRPQFEAWIAPDIARFAAAVDLVLAQSGAPAIDHVFLTGGTSFVPAVRRLFDARFGAERVSTGGEFVSVAEGLALVGRDRA